MASKGRPVLKILFKTFIDSFRIRQIKGDFKGEDYFGNKFYEIPKDLSKGKSKASRWFEPPEKENHEQEMTAEWASWLRGRRKEPPTEEELLKNLAIIKLKQKNAALIDEKYPNVKDHAALKRDETGQKSAFPTYEEYEIMPGKPKNSKD